MEDLRIVNVERKPAGMAGDLRMHTLDNETMLSLVQHGYFAVRRNRDDAAGTPKSFPITATSPCS